MCARVQTNAGMNDVMVEMECIVNRFMARLAFGGICFASGWYGMLCNERAW